MPRLTKNYHPVPDDFTPNDTAMKWINENVPTIDLDKTLDYYKDWARSGDWVYANWSSAFKNWLKKDLENNWGGTKHKTGLESREWRQLIIEAKELGFRAPNLPAETAQAYRTALRQYEPPESKVSGLVRDLFPSKRG